MSSINEELRLRLLLNWIVSLSFSSPSASSIIVLLLSLTNEVLLLTLDVNISLSALILGLITIPIFFVGSSILESPIKRDSSKSVSLAGFEVIELKDGDITKDFLNLLAWTLSAALFIAGPL